MQAHESFKKAYGKISDNTWALAQFAALTIIARLILSGHHSGDAVIVRESLRALKAIADE